MDSFQMLMHSIFSFFPPKSPVDFFPILTIIFFTYKISQFLLVKSNIEDSLTVAIAQLLQYKRNQGEDLETVQKISQALQGKCIAPQWIEFKESLVVTTEDDKKKYRNTIDSEHFFNFHNICKKLDFFNSVPGILTGFAILGTFIGIIYGFQSSGIAKTIQNTSAQGSTEAFAKSIGLFLHALGDAFSASVWGLALALVFTFIERKSASRLDELIGIFNNRINLIFPRQTPEELLIRIVEDSQSQLSALNAISNDLPNKIVGCLTDGGISKVEISSSVQKGIQTGFEGLGKRLAELGEFHDKYFAEVKVLFDNLKAVGDVVRDVTNANKAFSDSSKATADTLKITSETIERASAASGHLFDGIKNQAASFEQTTENFRTVGRDIGNMANTLSSASQYLVSEVKKSAEVFVSETKNLTSTATSTADGLKSGFSAIDQHMGSVVTQLGGAVGGINNSLENLVEKLNEIQIKLNDKGDKAAIGNLSNELNELKKAIEIEKKKVG